MRRVCVTAATALGFLLFAAAAVAAPSLVVTATDATIGATVHATADLSESPDATGEISFEVFGPEDPTCSGPVLDETSATVSGEGQYVSGDFAPVAAGTYHWSAHYTGDGVNPPLDSLCSATSVVAKASPTLSGAATPAAVVGETITDEVTLAGGFEPEGELVFRAYGPDDETCATTPAYEEAVAVNGSGSYSPPGFAPGAGLYRWTVEYTGDGNNEAANLVCGAAGQASAVGTIDVTLASGAGDGTVGDPVTATATLREGTIPSGQITFKAFPPGDLTCAGAPAFSSAVQVAGNGSYRSAAFLPTRVGTFRWTVTYSGDADHAPTTSGCGNAASRIAQARPTIMGAVPKRVTVGTAFRDTATLQGGYAPSGTITFRIYAPGSSGCTKPAFVNTVAIKGNGTFSSDPFVALRPGRYTFVAAYSGDADNQKVSEPCYSATQVVQVRKRSPKVGPRAVLIGDREISLRARLSGSVSPSGSLTFRLYSPADRRCARKPVFSGSISVKRNGTFPLGRYIATKPGAYRLSVGYSGDRRNQRYKGSCSTAQLIRVR